MSRETDRLAAVRRRNFAEANHFVAMLRERFESGVRLAAIEHGNHADAAVERAQHFLLGNLAGGGEPFEYRQNRHALERNPNAKPGWQHTRDVFDKAAAGNMRERLDRFALPDCGEAGSHIKPCRRQKRLAEILLAREWRGMIPSQSGVAHDLADQRKTVGMDPACRQS